MNRSGFVIVKKGPEQVGLVDAEGNEILPCIYTKIMDFDDDGYIRYVQHVDIGTIDLEGNPVISPSRNIIHLGVFYEGSARAQIGPFWGLVDERGEEVTAFVYSKINAYYEGCYKARTVGNIWGTLMPDGTFTPNDKKCYGRKYQEVRRAVDGVSPACTWDHRWVFIDEGGNRINDYEYRTLYRQRNSPVYHVSTAKGETVVALDGSPICDEWFDCLNKFEDGLCVCSRKRMNEQGFTEDVYGIFSERGTLVHPVAYSNLHWNDYDTRECWYAESEHYSHLLYKDGTCRTYNPEQVMRGKFRVCIPESEIDNFIRDDELPTLYHPTFVHDIHYRRFFAFKFYNHLYPWMGVVDDPDKHLKVYYRDTDAPIDERFYQRGKIICAGEMLEATQHMARPMHKTRFLIATKFLYTNDLLDNVITLPIREAVTHYNACFVVIDVQHHLETRQIVLLEIPFGAATIAMAHKLDMTNLPVFIEGFYDIKSWALTDLVEKSELPVHVNSVSDYWQKAMYLPVGLDEELKPVPVMWYGGHTELDDYQEWKFTNDYYSNLFAKRSEFASGLNNYITYPENHIKLVVGDICRLKVEAVVIPADEHLQGGGQQWGDVHDAAGRLLGVACRRHGYCRVGKCKITRAYLLQCKRVIHASAPVWHGGKQGEAALMTKCYHSALRHALKHHLQSIAFPAALCRGNISYTQAATIALRAILIWLQRGFYMGEVVICCANEQQAQCYLEAIKNNFDSKSNDSGHKLHINDIFVKINET